MTPPATCPTRATAPSATTPAASATLTVSPGGRRARAACAATTNYAAGNLRVDGGTDPAVESFLRFTVTGVPAGSVRSAKLRVYAYSGTVDGPGRLQLQPGLERDDHQLEQPARPHERRHGRQGRDRRRTAGSSTTSRRS